MSEPFSLPGYDLQALIGSGPTGEVWRARETATGETVALKRLRPDTGPAVLDALHRQAGILQDTPYVVRLRAVVGDVLVLDHAAGGSLASLLGRRRRLDPGEVVTVTAPLASALAGGHAHGLVHGGLSPAAVLLTAQGMPLLADWGLVGPEPLEGYADPATGAGGPVGTAADVWALAAVAHHLLAGVPPTADRVPLALLAPGAPPRLVAAVEAGLAADPARRPDAAGLGSLLRAAHPAAPVRLTGASVAAASVAAASEAPPAVVPVGGRRHRSGSVRRGGHRRTPARTATRPARRLPWRPPVRALPAVALGLLVVLAAAVGWLSGRPEEPRAAAVSSQPRQTAAGTAVPTGSPAPATADVDWRAVLDGLDAARSSAFAGGGVAALSAVWAPGSAGLAADAAAVRALAAAGQSAHGLRHQLRDVRVQQLAPGTARLLVVDVLADHEVRDRAGTVVRRVAARGSAGWQVELVSTAAGWRLRSVVPQT